MKFFGILLIIVGIIGTVFYGIQALEDSETVKFPGANIAVSTADWTPVIISGVLLFVGLVIVVLKRK